MATKHHKKNNHNPPPSPQPKDDSPSRCHVWVEPGFQVDFAERVYREREVEKLANGKQNRRIFIATVIGSALVLVYTVITGLAWSQSRNQMHIEYRPWVRVGCQQPLQPPAAGERLAVPVILENVGKSPANQINTSAIVEVLLNDEAPTLYSVEHEGPKNGNYIGIMFPSTPANVTTAELIGIDKVGQPYHRTVTEAEAENLRTGKAYIAVFGMVGYQDIFKGRHWTKYCYFHGYGQPERQIKAGQCANFNEVDAKY